MIVECDKLEPHTHEYPDDWIFGGPKESDPAADPRWQTVVYEYYNARAEVIHTTVVPRCDMWALDYFTFVADMGPGFIPVWVSARDNNTREIRMLPWTYDKETDEVVPRAS